MTEPVRGEARRYFPSNGGASALFLVDCGGEDWLVKVARPGTDSGRSMYAREWIFNRLAERMGLPVPPMLPIEVSPIDLMNLPGAPNLGKLTRRVFPATPLLPLKGEASWADLSGTDVARLFLWDCATSTGDGDKLRRGRPRDFFYCDWPNAPYVMLDFEALPAVFEAATRGASCPSRTHLPDYLPAQTKDAVTKARDDASGCFDAMTWQHIIDGSEHFCSGGLDLVRDQLAARVEAACQLLQRPVEAGPTW